MASCARNNDSRECSDLPQIVSNSLDERKYYYDPKRDNKTGEIITNKDKKKPRPVDPNVIDAFRKHIKAGLFRPDGRGGYIEIMQKLGHTPKSTDPFAKDLHLNIAKYNKCNGPEIITDVESHEGVLRYLRYQEFIDLVESKGLTTKDYFTSNEEPEHPVGPVPTDDEEEDENIRDDGLNKKQIKSLFSVFYVDYLGYISGVKIDSKASMESVSKIFREIKEHYILQQRPLGKALMESKSISKTRNNNKKKNKGKRHTNNKTPEEMHGEQIQKHLESLVFCVEANISPVKGFAKALFEISDMLTHGALFDAAISRCILCYQNGTLLKYILKLCHVAAQNAKTADCDNMPSTGYSWWLAYFSLNKLICALIDDVTTQGEGKSEKDFDDAIKAFKEIVLPDLLSTLQPKNDKTLWFSEERAIWMTLDRIFTLLPTNVAVKFVRKYWSFIEHKCQRDASFELEKRDFCSETARMREEHMAPRAIAECVHLVSEFCDCDIDEDDSVTASQIAIKALTRGIVPLLAKCSRSNNAFVASYAIFGLGQISRTKDCRDILLNTDGRKFVEELMKSKNAACISNSLLLVQHLSWDIEWCNSLKNMKPRIEEICLKLAAYSLKSLLQHVSMLKEKEEQDMHFANLQLKEVSIKAESRCKREPDWPQYERERWDQDPNITAISRSMMVLSSNLTEKDRLKKTDFLHLVGATVNVPIEDTFYASVCLFHNFIVTGEIPEPDKFADAEHFLDSLFLNFQQHVAKDTATKYTTVLVKIIKMLYLSKKWKPIYNALACKNENIKFLIQNICASSFTMDKTSQSQDVFGIDSRNTTLTGELAKCNSCGKIESRKDEWMKCARCMDATYCSRDCQKDDWKQHRKICAR